MIWTQHITRSLALLPFLALSLLLVNCGGSGGPGADSTPLTGVFVDSPVAGLTYETETLSGLTDTDGTFRYREGETVTFFLGTLELGSATGGEVITPIDIVPDAQDETHQAVVNICRFLQTLNEDGDPDNGIVLTPEVAEEASGRLIDFNQSVEGFEGLDTTALLEDLYSRNAFGEDAPRQLRSNILALQHFGKALYPDGGMFDGLWVAPWASDDICSGSDNPFIGDIATLVVTGNYVVLQQSGSSSILREGIITPEGIVTIPPFEPSIFECDDACGPPVKRVDISLDLDGASSGMFELLCGETPAETIILETEVLFERPDWFDGNLPELPVLFPVPDYDSPLARQFELYEGAAELLGTIEELIGDATCTDDTECRALGIEPAHGYCGWYSSFLAYSTVDMNLDLLLTRQMQYTSIRSRLLYGEPIGGAILCGTQTLPEVVCIESQCRIQE